ncbi:hypothetical protein [Mycoplasmopsis agassizii]|uniref:Lipoprotein n=1 Tax=Mycoplasmopsis agassizii TaxID=33922 RepID=A0ABX4H4M9_9BACT|nr:hypothetical protein [Mycoplasmopsis agassizii]PAF54839.1 hypothetical protein CJF60_03840 [Mycoplasmopsis agassizii]SMC18620.1 hypothetical protein SAMN02745179_00728 [Mycoplasmopsis agassizii]
MLYSPIKKYKKLNKLLLIASASIGALSIIALASCSYSDFKYTHLKKDAAIYQKNSSEDNKPYLKISTYGSKYYTFSNWYWEGPSVKEQAEQFGIPMRNETGKWLVKSSEKPEVKSENSNNDKNIADSNSTNVTKEWFGNKYKASYTSDQLQGKPAESKYGDFFYATKEMQKSEPFYLKPVSLIKNDGDLKSALRVDESGKKYYQKYFREIVLSDKTDKELYDNFSPWSNNFNYEAIKNKLDFKNLNYLFIKDFANLIAYNDSPESILEGGTEIAKYEIDVASKTIRIKFFLNTNYIWKRFNRSIGNYTNLKP